MRAGLVILAVVAIAGLIWLSSWPDSSSPTTQAGQRSTSGQRPVAEGSAVGTAGAGAMAADSGRTEAPLAAGQTTVQVRDDAGRPIAGAELRSLRDGKVSGTTDAAGQVRVLPRGTDQVAALAAGYYARQTAVAAGGPDGPVTLVLTADPWSLPGRFEFRRPDGALARTVSASFRPQAATAEVLPVPRAVTRAGETAVQAFREHAMIAAVLPDGTLHWHLGELSRQRRFGLGGAATVRFVEPGMYELECVADGEFVARALFQAEAIVDEPLVVELQAGHLIDGLVVRRDSSAALADASVALLANGAAVPLGTSDQQGRFRVGPLAAGAVTLELRHADMAPLRLGPLVPDGRLLQAAMEPLPRASLRGVVRARPRLQPIAAVVTVVDGSGQQRQAHADAEGWFAVDAPRGELLRLLVTADGFCGHRELVEAGGAVLSIDLWPADPEVRLREAISGMLSGRLVDARGQPMPEMVVQWLPDQPRPPDGLAERRIIEGAAPPVGLRVTSATDGTFRLETNHPGLGRLVPVDGVTSPEDGGLRVEAVLGVERSGLQVTCRKREDR